MPIKVQEVQEVQSLLPELSLFLALRLDRLKTKNPNFLGLRISKI